MLLAGVYRRPVLPGRPPVAVPGQLEDAGRAADALHAQTGAEATASGAQVVDEGGHGLAEPAALLRGEAVKVGGEARQGLVGGHGELQQRHDAPSSTAVAVSQYWPGTRTAESRPVSTLAGIRHPSRS